MPIQATKEVKDLQGLENYLSTSLRLSKFAKVGDANEKRTAINFAIKGVQERFRPVVRHPLAKTFIMKLGGRMIINQAGGVLENSGLCIHRHFGYPYIPGSAVKGIARHAAWLEWVDAKDANEKLETGEKIAMTFGYPTGDKCPKDPKKQIKDKLDYLDDYLADKRPELFAKEGKFATFAGSASFLPAIPEGKAQLETDVLTCHHMDYYAGKTTRALDNESPNPQFFPVVAEDTSFRFAIVPLRNSQNIKFAEDYLKRGLEELGIGAKTAAGYGWFSVDEESEAKSQAAEVVPKQELIEKYAKMPDNEFAPFINKYQYEDGFSGVEWQGTLEEQRSLLEYCLKDGASRVTAKKPQKAVNNLKLKFGVK